MANTQSKVAILLTATDQTKAAFSSAQSGMDKMKTAAGSLTNSLAAVGATLSVGAFVSIAKSSLDAADALNDMSIRTGVAVKDLASLKLIADQSGTSLEGIGAGLGKLNRSASEAAGGNKELAKALTSLGVTATTPLERFYQLADAVKGMEDPTARAADLSAVLGKSYLDLIPTLQQGSEGLRASAKASEGFADAMARLAPNADKFNDQLAQMKVNAAGAAASILANMIPSLNEYIDVMREVVKNGSLLDKVRFFGLGNASDEIVQRVRKASAAMDKAAESARNAAKSGTNAAQLECVASGGTWNGKECVQKKTKSTKTKKEQKLDVIDPFGPARRAAEDAAFKASIDAQNDAFDALSESRDYSIAQDEKAAAALGRMRAEQIALLDPIQQYREKLEEVQTLLDAGLLTPEQAVTANMYWQDQIQGVAGFGEELKKTKSEFDLFAEEALKGFQEGLADFLFDPFKDGLDGMLTGFGNMLKRMAAEAVAADITRAIFGNASSSGGGQNLLGSFAELFGFANGGAFTVGGSGGTDSQVVAFKATPGEEVAIRTPSQQRAGNGGQTINMTVITQDAASFSKSRGQIQADLAMAVSGARRFT